MPRLLQFVENLMLRKHLERQADQLGMEFLVATSGDSQEDPQIIVAELEHPQAFIRIRDWKSRWPDCFLALSVSEPDRERWIAAETVCCSGYLSPCRVFSCGRRVLSCHRKHNLSRAR